LRPPAATRRAIAKIQAHLSESGDPARLQEEAVEGLDGSEESAMRVMVLVKATADSEAGAMPSTELLTEMGRFNEALVDAGILQAGEGLHPSSKGKRVAFDGPERTVIDGPFAATGELVAGFWIWQVKDMDEAVAWVKRCPNPMYGPSEIEIRRIFEAADFGEALTPEIVAMEQRTRDKAAG
jgi:hypothetical protein